MRDFGLLSHTFPTGYRHPSRGGVAIASGTFQSQSLGGGHPGCRGQDKDGQDGHFQPPNREGHSEAAGYPPQGLDG